MSDNSQSKLKIYNVNDASGGFAGFLPYLRFKVGDLVHATSGDGAEYEGVVERVDEENRKCLVCSIGYETRELVDIFDLLPSYGQKDRDAQFLEAKRKNMKGKKKIKPIVDSHQTQVGAQKKPQASASSYSAEYLKSVNPNSSLNAQQGAVAKKTDVATESKQFKQPNSSMCVKQGAVPKQGAVAKKTDVAEEIEKIADEEILSDYEFVE